MTVTMSLAEVGDLTFRALTACGTSEANARSVLTDFLMSLGYTDVVIDFDAA